MTNVRSWFFCLAFFHVSLAQALPIDTYNLILFNDYNFLGGEVEGRTLIGGNLNAQGRSADFGSRIPPTPSVDTLTVVGDIIANSINMQSGNLTHGGTLNVSHINLNGQGEIIYDPTLSISAIQESLIQASSTFSEQATNGIFSNSRLIINENISQAIFHVSSDQIFSNNNAISLSATEAETVIINVSGNDIQVDGGVNLTSGFNGNERKIIWNFYEAESIDFANLAMRGSVLAPFASIQGGAVFDGAVVANEYTGSREFHNLLFTGNPPETISEPFSASLILIGLFATLFTRRRTRPGNSF